MVIRNDSLYEWPNRYLSSPKYIMGQKANFYFLPEENLLNRYFNTRCVCRAGLLPTKRNYEIISPVPEDTYTNMNFDEVCADSAQLCLDQAGDRNIHIMWSGGIDSTVVFFALQRTGVPLTLHCDPQVYTEAPKIYDDILRGEYPNVTLKLHEDHNLNEESEHEAGVTLRKGLEPFAKDSHNIFATGECGDQIFGTGRVFLFDEETRNKSYRETIPEWVQAATHKSTHFVLNKDDVNLKQWHWACSFMFKYQQILVRCKKMYGYIFPLPPHSNAFHFYDTPNFNRWSITNQDENSSWNKIREYKWAAKQWIYEQNGDAHYRDYKLKTPSSNRRRTKPGINFESNCDGFDDTYDWQMVIKKTFGVGKELQGEIYSTPLPDPKEHGNTYLREDSKEVKDTGDILKGMA